MPRHVVDKNRHSLGRFLGFFLIVSQELETLVICRHTIKNRVLPTWTRVVGTTMNPLMEIKCQDRLSGTLLESLIVKQIPRSGMSRRILCTADDSLADVKTIQTTA